MIMSRQLFSPWLRSSCNHIKMSGYSWNNVWYIVKVQGAINVKHWRPNCIEPRDERPAPGFGPISCCPAVPLSSFSSS